MSNPFSTIVSRRSRNSVLRIMTYNIFGSNADWDQRRSIVQPGIRELAPDLIGLHETTLTSGWDQVRDLLGDDFTIVHSRARGADGVGWATASRWPVVRSEELDLDVTNRTGDFPCTTIIAEIDVPAPFGPVLFVNHIPDWQPDHEYERELQAVVVARRVEELVREHPMHVVMAGDLDAELDAASVRFLTGRQSLEGMSVCYRDAWESVHSGERGETFTPRNPLMGDVNWDWPFRQIDHILVRCGDHYGPTLKIAGCELAFDRPVDGIWGSDHIALVADLVVP